MNCPGVSLTQNGSVHELAIELSGDQPESCGLLMQWMPVSPSRLYRLQWKAEPSGLTNPVGLTWRVRGPNLDLQSPDLLAEGAPEWQFQTPVNTRMAVLTLEYKRQLGQTRAKGNLDLEAVTLLPR
jgi:hypothetical protein